MLVSNVDGITDGTSAIEECTCGVLEGNGEGLRGPIGRRSDDCWDAERECPGGEFEPFVGVADSGRCAVDCRMGVSLDA
jgi:hypothetical protein